MRVFVYLFIICIVGSHYGYSQSDDARPVVGVSQFRMIDGEADSKHVAKVTEKVVEMLTRSNRYVVVDRISTDKIKEELELQKSEDFIDNKNVAKQGVAEAAQYIVVGDITKLPIYRNKNVDGSVNGYKASIALQLKIINVETRITSKATSFDGKITKIMLSSESAVVEAIESMEADLLAYFYKELPLVGRILSYNPMNKTYMTNLGSSDGFKTGVKFIAGTYSMIDGHKVFIPMAELKINKLYGQNQSECSVGKGKSEIEAAYLRGEKIYIQESTK